jgi:hypothetical protein
VDIKEEHPKYDGNLKQIPKPDWLKEKHYF